MIMKTLLISNLSDELQKFYLQNKQWLSDVLFLEDETRFFQKVFDRVFSEGVNEHFQDKQLLSMGLYKLEERRDYLKDLIVRQQNMLESMLEDNRVTVVPDLENDNKKIESEIKNLFISDRLIKKELFEMAEEMMRKDKTGHFQQEHQI